MPSSRASTSAKWSASRTSSVQIGARARRLGVADELADAAEDLAGAQRLVGDRVDDLEERRRRDVAGRMRRALPLA